MCFTNQNIIQRSTPWKWILEILKCKNEIYQRMELNGFIYLVIMFTLRESWKCQKWLIFCICCWWQQKIGHSLGKIFPILNKPEACNFIKKETLTQVLYCEFFEIFRTLFCRTPPDGRFWSCYWEQSRKYSPRWKIFSQGSKTPFNINFCNLFNRVEIFSPGWKSPYNQPLKCLTGFLIRHYTEA